MLKQFFLLPAISLFLLPNNVSGQNQTWLGTEGDIARYIFKVADNGNGLKPPSIAQAIWGFNLRQDFNHHLFLEAGFIKNDYLEGVNFKVKFGAGYGTAIDVVMIPLRVGKNINLCREKIYFAPVIGYSFCINSNYPGSGSGAGYSKSATDSVSFHYSEYSNFSRSFSLLQTGAGIEFKLFKTVLLTLTADYYTGFQKVIQMNISYKVNDSPQMTGEQYSTGAFWDIGIGLKYPISKIWAKNSAGHGL